MDSYEIIPNRDERCFDLYVNGEWHKSFGAKTEAETEREKLEAQNDEAYWEHFGRYDEQSSEPDETSAEYQDRERNR
jgi:hypothetical protein